MKIGGVVPLIACAGCMTASEPYPVVAVAALTGGASGITGSLEILGANSGKSNATEFDRRTLAAYRVRLPDSAPRRVRLYDARACDATEPLELLADLQLIRRVGDETHFFAQSVLVRGERLDVDTETAQAFVSLVPDTPSYVIGKIAVVQALDRDDGSPGAWLACGAFASVSLR